MTRRRLVVLWSSENSGGRVCHRCQRSLLHLRFSHKPGCHRSVVRSGHRIPAPWLLRLQAMGCLFRKFFQCQVPLLQSTRCGLSLQAAHGLSLQVACFQHRRLTLSRQRVALRGRLFCPVVFRRTSPWLFRLGVPVTFRMAVIWPPLARMAALRSMGSVFLLMLCEFQ